MVRRGQYRWKGIGRALALSLPTLASLLVLAGEAVAQAPPVSAGPPIFGEPDVVSSRIGESVERHLPSDTPATRWAQDPARLDTQTGDRLEQREVIAEEAETVKLKEVVPPIRFESGVAHIPPSTLETLRRVLQDMHELPNLRLHLVGHADDRPLSGALARVYGDNAGLSRERAGQVAEFLQEHLTLPPESISYEWAGDSQPVAPNTTAAGRALNRRVEVEVWYDEFATVRDVQDVVISEDIKRVKVCRMETVCKLRYRKGHAKRARVKNLIAPLRHSEGGVDVPAEFIKQVQMAFFNLRDKQNVTVKFIGFTDDVPLTGRMKRVYGTHLALSKARAQRVARLIQDALQLPTSAVASDGRGASRPVASNATVRGRSLNRRIEVEFWHDDPLQELPDEPLPCPETAGVELEAVVYDPPWGRLEPLQIEEGQPVIPLGYTELLRRAMADVADKQNVRLRFVGYTRNERLERRVALVYGDDIGLSTARARRTLETIRDELALSDSQVEHEGRGYLHTSDPVNAGFVQGSTSHVVVEVVYDEPAPLDDYEGVDITRITRELQPKDPLALNLMRITVDGEPIDDPGRSSADIQRCTDVALERADIRFRFDELEVEPRLSVTAHPTSVPVRPTGTGLDASPVRFRAYTNYGSFIERSEVRVFDLGESVQAEPIAVVAVDGNGLAHWQPELERFRAPVRKLQFLLRAYDDKGRFDETAPQPLWLIAGDAQPSEGAASSEPGSAAHASTLPDELLAGYGEGEPVARNIPLGRVGTVRVDGSGIPQEHQVWLAGSPVPVDESGNFVAEVLLPAGMHTVEVAVIDDGGNGELFLRDLELERNDWFYVGIADLTLSANKTSGPASSLDGKDAPYDYDSLSDGRLAFYVSGRFGDDWKLTASADTREAPVKDLFDNFLDKSPRALLRRIDPEYFYPTFGDDGTVEETAPTSGKFYVKLSQRENHVLWGNFKVGYLDNELAQVDRGLYGGNLHYETSATTSLGERRAALDGFVAQPGTIGTRDEFRGTGGSLYFLKRQDILVGSERVRIEIRDKDTGLVTAVTELAHTADYDIDYLQGRILLSEPVDATVADGLLVRNDGLSGNEAWLVVRYEYTPGIDDTDAHTYGGQGHVWLTDFLRLGGTASRDNEDSESTLYGADVTLRQSAQSWLKLQGGRSEGLVASSFLSGDGGFQFFETGVPSLEEAEAYGYRADVSLGLGDLLPGAKGRVSLYGQRLEAGYTAPGLTALTDTVHYGGAFSLPVFPRLELRGKADRELQDDGLESTAAEVDVHFQLTHGWRLGSGVRYEHRDDRSPIVPQTQEEGSRADGVFQLEYDSRDRWSAYGFAQTTFARTGDRDANNRYGVGGAYRLNERIVFDGEASHGTHGPAVKIGTSYQESEATHRYLSYAFENERGQDGMNRRRGNLVSGVRSRLSDSSSVYLEDRFEHSDSRNGLTRSMGITLAPTDRWTLSANWEYGKLFERRANAETRRNAGGANVAYAFEDLQLTSAIEYRSDETEQLDGSWTDRTTWLFRNSARLQLSPDWRLLAKLDHATSDSSEGDFFDGGYTEAVLGYAFRPVKHDRLNALAKYTYFYNVPTTDQVTGQDTAAEFIQKSHILSMDVGYDILPFWSVGLKYAYRLSQVSLDREDPDFFDNDAHLFILRNDLRFLKNWETSIEGRMLYMPELDERRSGAVVTLYRYLGDHLKVGVGYNFTDFSDDLTDLSYDHHGVFFNVIGSL